MREYLVYASGLFEEAVSSSNYTISNGRMIVKFRICRDLEESGRDLSNSLVICHGGTEKNH
jgi:hypothetical protein